MADSLRKGKVSHLCHQTCLFMMEGHKKTPRHNRTADRHGNGNLSQRGVHCNVPSFFLSLLSGSVCILGLIDYNSSKWFEWKRVTLMKLWKDYVLTYLISLWRKRNEVLAKKWIVFKTHKISLYYSTPSLAKEQPVNTADTLEGMCATSTQHLQISTGIWILGRKQKQRQEVAASSWLVAHMNMLGVPKERWDKCSPLEFREALLPMA